jgi:co-chaperonin GroES (HSP10)
MKNIEAFGKNILANEIDPPVKKTGALILQNQMKNIRYISIVDGGPTPLVSGDVAIISNYGGIEIEFNDKKYLLLKEDDILAKIKE